MRKKLHQRRNQPPNAICPQTVRNRLHKVGLHAGCRERAQDFTAELHVIIPDIGVGDNGQGDNTQIKVLWSGTVSADFTSRETMKEYEY